LELSITEIGVLHLANEKGDNLEFA